MKRLLLPLLIALAPIVAAGQQPPAAAKPATDQPAPAAKADEQQATAACTDCHADQGKAFASNPQIQEFFGRLFAGPPEVTLWADSGWNKW